MRARQVGSWLLISGIVGIIASVIWWQSFYTQVDRFLGAKGPLPVACLYELTGSCRMVSNVASFFGAGGYDPLLLWASVAAIIVGVLMRR